MSSETLIQLIRWRLGLPFSGDVRVLTQEWDSLTEFQRWDLADSAAIQLGQLLRQTLTAKVEGKPLPEQLHWANGLAPLFIHWLGQQTVASPKVAQQLGVVAKRFQRMVADPTAATGPPISQERVRVGPPIVVPPTGPQRPPTPIRPTVPPPPQAPPPLHFAKAVPDEPLPLPKPPPETMTLP